MLMQLPEFNDNGGSGGSGTVNAVYDAALSSVAIPVCKGKVFDGYFVLQMMMRP